MTTTGEQEVGQTEEGRTHRALACYQGGGPLHPATADCRSCCMSATRPEAGVPAPTAVRGGPLTAPARVLGLAVPPVPNPPQPPHMPAGLMPEAAERRPQGGTTTAMPTKSSPAKLT